MGRTCDLGFKSKPGLVEIFCSGVAIKVGQSGPRRRVYGRGPAGRATLPVSEMSRDMKTEWILHCVQNDMSVYFP